MGKCHAKNVFVVHEVESVGFVEIFCEKRCHNYISEVNYWLSFGGQIQGQESK